MEITSKSLKYFKNDGTVSFGPILCTSRKEYSFGYNFIVRYIGENKNYLNINPYTVYTEDNIMHQEVDDYFHQPENIRYYTISRENPIKILFPIDNFSWALTFRIINKNNKSDSETYDVEYSEFDNDDYIVIESTEQINIDECNTNDVWNSLNSNYFKINSNPLIRITNKTNENNLTIIFEIVLPFYSQNDTSPTIISNIVDEIILDAINDAIDEVHQN